MTGLWKLVRLILRRDRVVLPVWVLPLALLPAATLSSFQGLMPTDAERLTFAKVGQTNAGFVALYGPLHGDSFAVLTSWRMGFVPVMVGLFSLLTIVRHTRADEEAGRSELIGATVVGRHAQLAAALFVVGVADLLLGLVVFASMRGEGTEGALAFGAEFTAAGWIFAAVAAITAQLTSGARSARSIAIIALGACYALRVGGDISGLSDGSLSWLSWVSPIGWVTHIFPFAALNWWPVVLSAIVTVVAVVVAVILRGRRDLGDGLFASRLGRATAAPGLATPFALAWRLHRGLLAGWTVGFALLGVIFGGVGGSVLDIAKDNKGLSDIFANLGGSTDLVASFFAGIAGVVGIIAACYAVQATLRLRDEETTGHAEAVLSTSVSRFGWAASHLVFSLLGPAVALLAEGVMAWLTYTKGDLPGIITGTIIQLPAVWTLSAVGVLLFGLLPRWSAVAWVGPAVCLLILLLGTTLQFSQWVLDISPFTHVPHQPGGDLAVTPLVTLVAVTVVLTAAGLVGLRRRNVPD